MNEYHFLVVAERLLALYRNHQIIGDEDGYSNAFRSLMGELADAVSSVE